MLRVIINSDDVQVELFSTIPHTFFCNDNTGFVRRALVNICGIFLPI